MFWKYNLITASHIETLLDKENVTLKELMEEEDILQECKAQSNKLLDFIVRPDTMDEMVSLITQEPDKEIEERLRYKYSNIACELLTFDIDQINDALVCDEALLNKLYNFLSSDQKLNPLLASFFSKTMGLLISKRTETFFNFLKSKDFITLLLNHMETSAIMDLLVRFITSVENKEMKTAIMKWLNENQLIERLIKLIDVSFSEDCNCYAAHALCDIIKSCREHMSLHQEKAEPNPLLEAIESTALVSDLLTHVFRDVTKESALINGMSVLLALLEFKKQGPAGIQQLPTNPSQPSFQAEIAPQAFISPFFRNSGPEQMTALDAERLTQGVNNVLAAVTPRLEDFHNIILNPPSKPAMKLTYGQLDPPFGYCRLEISHLITALISTNNHLVNVKLSFLGTVVRLLDLFFKYSWNNFLHTQVEQTVGRIITNGPTVDEEENKIHPLLDQILSHYKLTVKILECFEEDHEKNGYMGHLTKIANHIAQSAENGVNSVLIKEKIKGISEEHNQQWEEFVNNKLAEINRRNTTHLVGGPPMSSSSGDDSVDFRDMPFGTDTPIHQAFSDYQMQEMTSNFVDQFGFNDDEFGEADENLSSQLKRLSHVNFNLGTGDNMRNSELFEQICCEKSSNAKDADSDEEVWEYADSQTTFHSRLRLEENSSDSDEEAQVFDAETTPAAAPSDEVKMDVDHQESWAANFDSVPMEVAPVPLANPWESTETTTTSSDDQGNWADFSNFANFGASNSESSSSAASAAVSVAMETSETSAFNLKSIQNNTDILSGDAISISKIKEAAIEHAISPEDSDTLLGEPDVTLTKDFEETKSNSEGCIRQKDMSALFDEESCSPPSLQKGPI